MKHLLPLIFVTLLLAGCTSQGSTENSVKDDSGTKMTADQLFEKKKECIGYKENIQKDIKEMNRSNPGDKKFLYLDSIFYSPKLNSCLYYTRGRYVGNDSQFDLNFIIDYFTQEIVLSTPNFCNGGKEGYGATQCPQDSLAFLQQLEELKRE